VYPEVTADARYTSEANTLGLFQPIDTKRIAEVRFGAPKPLKRKEDASPSPKVSKKPKEEKTEVSPVQGCRTFLSHFCFSLSLFVALFRDALFFV
jgi:hypothetical protein